MEGVRKAKKAQKEHPFFMPLNKTKAKLGTKTPQTNPNWTKNTTPKADKI